MGSMAFVDLRLTRPPQPLPKVLSSYCYDVWNEVSMLSFNIFWFQPVLYVTMSSLSVINFHL